MGMQAARQSDGSFADMNVVPLIDILLVLIIIFMVITPLAPKGLKALLPQPTIEPPPEGPVAKLIVVRVAADGSVSINEEQETWEGLGPRLEGIFAERAQKVAFVRGESQVEFASVARAMDIMRAAGIENIGLLTPRLEAGR